MPAKSDNKDAKVRALCEEGTLNPVPEKVRDPKFLGSEFFDSRDIVQVKYEMLRRVSVENASVASATEEYGVSRPTYYQTKASFEETGIAGLVPRKRGPRGPHKVRGAVLAFIQEQLVAGEPIRARQLAKLIRQKFHLDVHPRTSERAAAVKKRAMTAGGGFGSERLSSIVAQHESLRSAALGQALSPDARCGLLLFLRRGMWGWAQVMAMPGASLPQQPERGTSLRLTATDEYRTMVHVFAAMAMNAERRGAAL